MIGRKVVDAKHLIPDVDLGVDTAEPRAALRLRRDRRVVDEGVQLMLFELRADVVDGAQRIGRVGEIDLNVVLGVRHPTGILPEGMARAGDDAPARAGKADHGRMPDAAARAGQQQRAARRVGRL